MNRLSSRGDTIVEVLIAILIVSVIMSGAFVSARKSQTAIRSSQERVEGLKVAEGQVERIRAAANTKTPDLFSPPVTTFCLDSTNTRKSVSLNALATDNFSIYQTCKSTPTGVDYYFVTERDTATNTFVVHTRWDGVNGTGKQEIKLAVRIDP